VQKRCSYFPRRVSQEVAVRNLHGRLVAGGNYRFAPRRCTREDMRRVLLWTFTLASLLFWGLAVVMALLEVVHLAHGQPTEHAAGTFAVQALVVAVVFTVRAHVSLRPAKTT
jgi:hypothetical protein